VKSAESVRAPAATTRTAYETTGGAALSTRAQSSASFANELARYRLGGNARASSLLAARASSGALLTSIAASGAAAEVPPVMSSASSANALAGASATRSAGAMAISQFPRPADDNGRGMHWIPITHTTDANVDRFVDEAEQMGVKWMVILNDGTKIGENDYLVNKLTEKGIMPIMRVYTPEGRPIEGDLGALVQHYKSLGVQYYQLYNEPNLNVENPDGKPNVARYTDLWVRDAKKVVAAGGLPGFGALSPGGNFDDVEFLKQSLDRIKATGETATLDKAWVSLHNYTLNHPLDYSKDSNGFLKYRFYDQIIKDKVGRQMPIIGTEGGTFVGADEDKTLPKVTEQKQVEMVTGAYEQVEQRHDPYFLAYSYWVIANEEGGGHDQGFTRHALFQSNGKVSPVVQALKKSSDRT
jgi:hypothetical protein